VLKKPIIPLLLEPVNWPPKGMGPIFGQLIYINCYEPSTDIQHNWDCPQFEELIRQINSHIRKQKTGKRNI